MNQELDNGEAMAASLDARDALAAFRDRFYVPDGTIYLDGNSLGLLSLESEASVLAALESWKRHGVSGWLGASPPWFTLGEQMAASMAPLVGADPEAVIVTGPAPEAASDAVQDTPAAHAPGRPIMRSYPYWFA